MGFLAAEQRLKVPQRAAIVGEREATVRRWLTRSLAEGLNGLQDAPRPGRACGSPPCADGQHYVALEEDLVGEALACLYPDRPGPQRVVLRDRALAHQRRRHRHRD